MLDDKIKWPGGEHAFALGIEELEALQATCDAAPGAILRSLVALDCNPSFVQHTLRLGLIGGWNGKKADKAMRLVKRMAIEHGMGGLTPYAILVMTRALYPKGMEDDQPEVPGKPETETPMQNGGSPKSTEPDP